MGHAIREKVMEGKINKSRHQMVQEEITMEINEIIDHPITKDQSQLATGDQIGTKTTGIKTTEIKTAEDLQTTENSKTGITTLARKRKEGHQINNHLNAKGRIM